VTDDSDQIAYFERIGSEAVRHHLYNAGFNLRIQALAIKWLAEKDQDAGRLRDANQAEQIALARSADKAAWTAARQAKIANKIAIAALVAATIAIIVSIISLTHSQ